MRTSLLSLVVPALTVVSLAGCPSTQIVPPEPSPDGPRPVEPETSDDLELTEVAQGTRIRITNVDSADDSVVVDAVCTVVELARDTVDDDWWGAVDCGRGEVELEGYEQLVFIVVK